KIDIPSLLLELRQRAVQGDGEQPRSKGSLGERVTWKIWSWFTRSPGRYRFASRMARLGDRVPLVKRLLPPMRAWASSRELPRLARRSFRDGYRKEQR
ncbi:MAG: DUF3390 domain-containing protein, partial [Planctomycetes bacterium]|nr:DUF3390 domain-containing protein [Planctomycetota bacterium]